MRTKVFFDMDGTVADLYGTEGWLEALQEERPIFTSLPPMTDPQELRKLCQDLKDNGIGVGIITWLPMFASEKYEMECTIEKRAWVDKYMPEVEEFYALRYGTPKQYAPFQHPDEIAYLVDDNDEVIDMWSSDIRYPIKVSNGNTVKVVRTLFNL